MAKAIVNERAVMIEEFNAAIASEAVERSFRFDDLVVGTEVIKVQVNVKGKINELNKVVPWLQETRSKAH